jgi:hypothetical protein
MTFRELHTPVRYPAWQREYEAAVLELDPGKLHGLLMNARAAIARRLESLKHENLPDERAAIANAMIFLRLLARGAAEEKNFFRNEAS